MKGSQWDYLIRDPHDLVVQLDGLRVDSHTFFIEVDVADFFMSGKGEELVSASTEHIPDGPKKSLMQDVTRLLLRAQFIESKLLPDRLWQVQQGTGMGLRHSGEIADSSFANLVEVGFAARKEIQKAFSILHYSRYRDNMLIIGNDRRLAYMFLGMIMDRSRFFQLTIEQCKSNNMHYLNITINNEKGVLRTAPAFKASMLNTCSLESTSAHPPRVHG